MPRQAPFIFPFLIYYNTNNYLYTLFYQKNHLLSFVNNLIHDNKYILYVRAIVVSITFGKDFYKLYCYY